MAQNVLIELDSNIFSRESITKCLYWYSNGYFIDLKLVDGVYKINFEPFNEISKNEIIELKKKLNQDFLDYNLREIVKHQTTNIRELIIAKAFSNGEFDEEPKGDMMDPLGIKFL